MRPADKPTLTPSEHADAIEYETGEVRDLAGLIETVGNVDDSVNFNAETALTGLAVVARVIAEKMRAIDAHMAGMAKG